MRTKGLVIDIAIGLGAIAVALWIALSTPLGILNAKVTDLFLYAPITPSFEPKSTIIKNTTEQPVEPAVIRSLINQLNAHGAAHVIVLDNSAFQRQSRTTTAIAEQYDNVSVAEPGQEFVEISEQGLALFSLNNDGGIYRSFSLRPENSTLLNLYDAELASGTARRDNGSTYFFNYRITPQLIPSLSINQALQGGIVPQLVNDKVVFLQINPSGYYEGLQLPQSLQPDTARYVDLQALAAETLYQNYQLTMPPWLLSTLALVLLYFASFLLLQVLNARGILLFEAAVFITGLVLSYAVFVGASVVLPFGELVVTQLMALLHFLMSEKGREIRMLSARTAGLKTRLSQKIVPQNFLTTEDPWKTLHVFIDQHLNMRRSILLARVESQHRVNAIHSLNCTIDDIDERRRDYQRAPYSKAIELQRPYRLGQKRYFNDVTDNEIEYLVPLIFAGDVLGFWALTVEPDKQWSERHFEQNLTRFGNELSELLYHRNRFIDWQQKEGHTLRRLVNLSFATKEQQQLDAAIQLLERRVELLQNMFASIHSAMVLYNLFGHVLTTNAKIDKLAAAMNISLYTSSAHDLLVTLTGESASQVKQLLSQVTLNQQVIEWPITSPQLDADYILRVSAVSQHQATDSGVAPFALTGILFEFIEVHLVQQVIERKQGLYRQYFNRLDHQLSAMRTTLSNLQHDNGAAPEHTHTLQSQLEQLASFSHQTRHMLELQQHSNELLPVNPAQVVKSILRKQKKLLATAGVEVHYEFPAIPPLALASIKALERLLMLVVQLLIDDTRDDHSTITVTLEDFYNDSGKHCINVSFSNQGFGVPPEQLDQLNRREPIDLFSDSSQLAKLLYQSYQVEEWGAHVSVSTELGKGFKITLNLPPFEGESPLVDDPT